MGREFSLDEARRLIHNQKVELKGADGKYIPGIIQGNPKIKPMAVFLDVMAGGEFRMNIHFSFLRKPQ
jgi:hypothetical protein